MAHGYSHRFGIVHVDFASQRRTPKAGAFWYRNVSTAAACLRSSRVRMPRPTSVQTRSSIVLPTWQREPAKY
jgi:beta-glucosidase